MSVGAQSVLHPGRPHARPGLRRPDPPPADGVLRRPHALRRAAAAKDLDRYDLSSLRLCVSAGEALPAGAVPPLARPLRRRAARRDRDHRDPAHLPVQPPGRRPARLDRTAGAGLRGGGRGRRGPGRPRRGDRQPPRPRRLDHGVLLEPARQDPGRPARRVDPDRGQVLPGPRRLLLVLRSRRRHAEGRRHLGLAGRGRDTLVAHPAVLEAAVVGQEDDDRLVKPKAYVVLKDRPRPRRRSPTRCGPS